MSIKRAWTNRVRTVISKRVRLSLCVLGVYLQIVGFFDAPPWISVSLSFSGCFIFMLGLFSKSKT